MKNWRTTLAGAVLAVLSYISIYQGNGGDLNDWKLWAIPAAIQLLTFLTKDHNVTGGTSPQ